jgi:hypothetical protein
MYPGKKFLSRIAITAITACSLSSQAFAIDGCIVLKSVAEVEQEIVDAKGAKSKKLVPVDKAVPGVEVIWTVTANNICKQPSDKVTINLPVPQHMSYVPNSAIGPGSDVSFSVDGKTFGTNGQLTVQENGAARPARTDEYRHVRWTFKDSLQPGATAMARFRAVLN